jgi:membrane protein DedA with SNARE-associated domain
MRSQRTRSLGQRPRLILVLTLLAVSYSAELTARALLPILLRDHPLLLVSLDSNTHDVLLAGLKLPLAELVVVAVAWRFAVRFVHYLVGLWYGDVTLRWLRRKWTPSAFFLKRVEVTFDKIGVPAVVLFSDNWICLLAGATGMRMTRFAVLSLAGTLLHVFTLVLIMRHTQGALGKVATFIDGDVAPLTIICIIATVAAITVMTTIHRAKIREFIADFQTEEENQNSNENDKGKGDDAL